MDEQLRSDIETLLEYLWEDEAAHYEEMADAPPANGEHIFQVLLRIKAAL